LNAIRYGLFIAVFMFQIRVYLLVLSLLCLTAKLAVAGGTGNTTAIGEDNETLAPRIGIVSGIVGGIVEPLNVLLPPKSKEIILSPVKDVADALDSKLKAIYPGKLSISYD
jgi:hypothetical protein